MAYQNFIPAVWAEGIERELERLHVFATDCNKEYEGEVTKQGDSVHILGVGKPTIKTTANKKNVQLGAEDVEDTSVVMQINQIAYFDFKIDDIDKRQAVGGVADALRNEAAEGIADVMDKYVADKAKDNAALKYSASDVLVTKDNILGEVDKAIQKLYENDVKTTTPLFITLPPRAWTLFKQAYIALDTDNSKMIKNGKMAQYGGATIRMSNNCAKNVAGTVDYVMCRTNRAIAFANPLTHVEPYRPEKSFSDAVKGFSLYDAKIVRPKELCILNWKYA
ncbi:MAG: hypothetical protein IJN27_01670 [Oscillospiraceae bacterium]|nr:hypothetical protein [Oscillospiraceae bacterium]